MTWDAIAWNVGLGIIASAIWEGIKAVIARLRPPADKELSRPADRGGSSMRSDWKFWLPPFFQNALVFAAAFAVAFWAAGHPFRW